MIGIIGADVGVTTGLAWGIYNQQLRDDYGIWHALARGRAQGWAEIEMGSGVRQGTAICAHILGIIGDFNIRGLRLDVEINLAIEDFYVRKDLRGGGGRNKLAPVFVGGMIWGVLSGSNNAHMISWLQPSQTKAFATDDRLKRWAARRSVRGRAGWIPGKPHARDAWRLVATQLEQTI